MEATFVTIVRKNIFCFDCLVENISVWKKLTKESNNCRICLTSRPRDIKHIRQSNLSTSKQIFVFPSICLCWWKTSSSDGRKHLIECKEKTATKYRFSRCYFFFPFFTSYVSSKLVAFFTSYVSSELVAFFMSYVSSKLVASHVAFFCF